jgi:molecular chaperone DnaK
LKRPAREPIPVPQIEVSFNIDANGIVNVSAKDKATGKEQKITITGGGNLSKEDIDKMQKDAEAHAEDDKKKKEQVEARNQADTLIYTAEKTLKDAEGKVSDEDKKAVEDATKALKDKLNSEDLEELKKLTDDLSTKLQKVGEAMYKQEAEKTEKEKASTKPEEAETKEKSEDSKDKDAEEGEVVDKKDDK